MRTVRQLLGGTHAVTLLLATDDPRRQPVLRQDPPGDDAPVREARVLEALDGLDGWAPRLLGVGAPRGFLLFTRLPGRAASGPSTPRRAARELAWGLARVHAAARRPDDTGPRRHAGRR